MGYNEHVWRRSMRRSIATGACRSVTASPTTTRCAPELLLHNTEIEAWVRQWLAELSIGSARVIERRYGLNGLDVATLEELARELGVTRERVRQIQAEALEKLRARLERRGLDRDALL